MGKRKKSLKCSKHRHRIAFLKCKCGLRFCKECSIRNGFMKKYINDTTYKDCLCGQFVEEV